MRRREQKTGRPRGERLANEDVAYIKVQVSQTNESKSFVPAQFHREVYDEAVSGAYKGLRLPGDVESVKSAFARAFKPNCKKRLPLPLLYWRVLECLYGINRDSLPSRSVVPGTRSGATEKSGAFEASQSGVKPGGGPIVTPTIPPPHQPVGEASHTASHEPPTVDSLVTTTWPTTVLSTRKDTPQWTDFREINLKGECLRYLGCTIVTSSPYFRFGFKLLAWGVRIFGDASIKSQDSNLIVHIGRNNWDRPKLDISANDIFFTYSVNGIGTENDKPLFAAEPRLTASLELKIENGYASGFFVNGICCLNKIMAPEICRRVVMLAWGDNEEYAVEVRDLSVATAHVL